jgi:hypothetical protein
MRSNSSSFANIVELALRSARKAGIGWPRQAPTPADKGMCVLIANRHKIMLNLMLSPRDRHVSSPVDKTESVGQELAAMRKIAFQRGTAGDF